MKAPICLIVAFVCGFAIDALAAYGVKWTPGDEESVAGAYLVAESAFEMRMRQPDGKVRLFHRDFESPNLLYGDEPWVGEDLGGGVFKILTNPEFKGGRTGFVFKDGHLMRMAFGRKDYNFKVMPYPASTNSLESLWPRELTNKEALDLFGTWRNAEGRWRLGYANPNKGGCLCAEFAVLALALLLFAKGRKWTVVAGAVLGAIAFFLLVKTESRSAFVAFAAGALALLAFRMRFLFAPKRILVIIGVLAIVAGVICLGGVSKRFTTGIVDVSGESDAFRVKVWSAAPKMMVDAPSGWGLRQSGVAYSNWYQPPTDFKVSRTLVNSHLTWLVEFGWFGRFLYVWAVVGGLLFLFAIARRGASPLPAALFLTLFVAGAFNSVMESPTLWFLPLAVLAVSAYVHRHCATRTDTAISFAAGAVFSLLCLVTFAIVGSVGRAAPELYASGGRVVVNGKHARTWVVDDNVVLGKAFLGKELRMYYEAFPQEPPLGLVWNVADLPKEAEHVVLAGKRGADFLAMWREKPIIADGFKSIVFISPSFAASSLPPELASRNGVKVYQGELAARLTPDMSNPPDFLKVITGAELYIPGWMRIASADEKSAFRQNNPTNKKGETTNE